MKKIVTTLFLGLVACMQAQTIETFESFTLAPNSFYKDTNSVPFTGSNATFRHRWVNGTSPYWSGGFSYTNKKDSTNGNFNNLYNCRAVNGYNNSNYYVTGQNNGIIKLNAPFSIVDGFYFTNTTYAYKSMKFGDSFAKKFGGPSGNDPDYFRVIVKGYKNGVLKTDSSVFYLADFRSTNNSLDYIVEGWQYVSCSNIGQVDSIKFTMQSSDVGSFGINTPLFFSLDNFTTSSSVGINEFKNSLSLNVFPNPSNGYINIHSDIEKEGSLKVFNQLGQLVFEQNVDLKNSNIDLSNLTKGIYIVKVSQNEKSKSIKIVLY
ncbi:MAG: DUF4465 domain-containing protein [Bacteroidetes bacterium]|jgi:hypothetical protein|nr:DUF4465 domain-containing protein [Bacteroidota bacterium]MCA6443634.1 DUF4465 domain-containing protein [Bacteroidota bacterium]